MMSMRHQHVGMFAVMLLCRCGCLLLCGSLVVCVVVVGRGLFGDVVVT